MTGPAEFSEQDGDFRRVLALLQEAVHKIAGGDLSVRLAETLPEDHPVGALVASVNGMVDALDAAQEESRSYQQQLQDQLETIEAQREAIRELSTPVIEVLAGVLCVPIVGILDSRRAAELTTALLDAVVARKARLAIIDITGIDIMDTSTCDYFLRMVRSVSMLGSRCVLSGISPSIASTIVQMDADLAGVQSFRSLRHALKHFVLGSRSSRFPNRPTRSQNASIAARPRNER